MMGFGWWFAALAVLAVLFVAWPLLSRRSARHEQIESLGDEFAGRVAFNDALFAEQLQDLDDQRQRDEITPAQYDKLKSELELQNRQDTAIEPGSDKAGSSSRGAAVLLVIAIALPALGFWSYWQMGAAKDVEIQQLNNQLVQLQRQGEVEATQSVNRELYNALIARLENQPDNLNNRFLLARTAVEMRDFPRALEAYRYILERQPNSPAVLAEMAQVLFIAAGNRFTPEVQQLFDKALALDPQNSDVLGFAGLGAYQSGNFETAISYWKRGLAALDSGDPRSEIWQAAIAQARLQLGEAPDAEKEQAADEASDLSFEVAVSVAEGVQLPPQATVFVYARAWQGPRAPLAMQQVQVSDLPTVLELDESMYMVAGMTMSRFPQLEIIARVSQSGMAEAQPGDWQGSLGPVASNPTPETLKLVIDSQIP